MTNYLKGMFFWTRPGPNVEEPDTLTPPPTLSQNATSRASASRVRYPMDVFGTSTPSAENQPSPASLPVSEQVDAEAFSVFRTRSPHIDRSSVLGDDDDGASFVSARTPSENEDAEELLLPGNMPAPNDAALGTSPDDEYEDEEMDRLLAQLSEIDIAALERQEVQEVEQMVQTPSVGDAETDIEDMEMEDTESPDSSPNTSFTTTSSESYTEVIRRPVGVRFIAEWDPTPTPRASTNMSVSRPPGVDLKKYAVIAHSLKHQKWFDKHQIPWAAQYLTAVYLTAGLAKWEDITETTILQMKGDGTNTSAGPLVRAVLRPQSQPRSQATQARRSWLELDKEDAAFTAGSHANLGLIPTLDGKETMGSWWAGRVEQRVKLYAELPTTSMMNGASPTPIFTFRLQPHETKGKSYRLSRKFGSRRLLQVSLAETRRWTYSQKRALEVTLRKGILLMGRVFRAICYKDGTVRLVETDENVDRDSNPDMGDMRRLSFFGTTNWFNPLATNSNQIMSKYANRFSLAFSTSNPSCIFPKADIMFIADIISPAHQGSGKPSSNHVMTDGCGRINRAALRLIQRQQGLSQMPSAIQGRIAGAKGVWLLDETDLSETPKISITESQVKIAYSDEEMDDPCRRILDLLRIGKVKSPARLGNQPIVNFAHNGVPADVFTDLLEEGLCETLDHLLDEWQEDDTLRMWEVVSTRHGVNAIKRHRATGRFLREMGHFGENEATTTSLDLSQSDESILDPDVPAEGPDPNSGCPSDLAEQVAELLQAGFTPRECRPLERGMKGLLKTEVTRMTGQNLIPVKRSAEAFAVPDFSGVLKPGEVFFRASQAQECGLVDDPKMADGVARGPLLIFRYPTRTPSDAQLVTAVDCPSLYSLTDVLVFSTQGDRSGASILAGGDYDGDTVHILSDPRLVGSFVNADVKFADPPEGFDQFVEQDSTRGPEFLVTLSGLADDDARRSAMQEKLLAGCTREDLTGMYSTFADIATYQLGYDGPEAWYLAYMFSNELDSQKSGRHVLPEILKMDRLQWSPYRLPDCMAKGTSSEDYRSPPPRGDHMGQFILDNLRPFAQAQERIYLDRIQALPVDNGIDQDLVKVIRMAEERAKRQPDAKMIDEVNEIKTFVDTNRAAWNRIFQDGSDESPEWPSQSSQAPRPVSFFRLPKKMQQQRKREIARKYWEDFPLRQWRFFDSGDVRRVMASYAYWSAQNKSPSGSTEYAFVVAFEDLTAIKAAANGRAVTMGRTFYDCLQPRKGLKVELRDLEE